MRKALAIAIPVLSLSLLAFSPACGDDHDDDHDTEETLTGDCKAISDACHELDDGTGEAHECHEVAHAGKAADCTEHLEHCLETCAGGDGGTHSH